MKASELVSKGFFKGLIYGPAGVGKTCLACQFEGPIEIWDFDSKIESAVNYLPTVGKKELLHNIDVYRFAHLPIKERIPAWMQRSQLIDKCIQEKKPFHFKTLIIDSMTTFCEMLMIDYITRSHLGVKRPAEGGYTQQDYGFLNQDISRLLPGLLAQDINLIVLAHVDVDKDENTGMIERKPLVMGRALAPKFPAWFPEVYAMVAKQDGSRWLITQPMNGYVARCQRGLAKEIPAKIEEILK